MRSGDWANSGYGVQSRSLLPRLANLPHFGGRQAIAQFAWYGLHGGMHQVDGFAVYPGAADPYGNDVIAAHAKDFGANIVVTLIDAWVLNRIGERVKPALFLPWLPIDHDPVPDKVLESIADAHLPITYSKWGHAMLNRHNVPNHYIPHGIEPTVYHVAADRAAIAEFKRGLTGGLDQQHLTVMVAANKGYPDRKGFQQQLRAWAAFAQDKPHAWLYMHTEPTTLFGGIDMGALLKNLGIQQRVIFPDRYQNGVKGLPPEYLALVYNAADVYLGAAMSEGFGIPIVEAQACGTPVVVTDFSAMPELVRWGRSVPMLDRYWTPMNAWQALPDWVGIRQALEYFHSIWLDNGRDLPLTQRHSTMQAIHAEYDWDAIVRDQWTPLMDKLVQAAPPLDSRFQVAVPDAPQAEVAA